MPLSVSFDIRDIQLRDDQARALSRGVLDPDQLMLRFVTQHDGKVRPSHAALHGTVWRLDDQSMPVPPLDFGCRCHLEHVAVTGTPAAELLPHTDRAPRDSLETAYSDYLEEALGTELIESATDAVRDLPKAEQLNALWLHVRAHARPEWRGFARDLARMLLTMMLA